jgi:undecaprenyl diphosphate synthase
MLTNSVPSHVAIIMDGNGRWAKARNLPRTMGHKKGMDAVKNSLKFCLENKIPYLTVFAFAKDNWKRPPEEVQNLFKLFRLALKKDIQELHERGICLKIIGNREELDPQLMDLIEKAEALTAQNKALRLNVAINYNGHWDITHAVKKMQALGESEFTPYLSLAGCPEPELLIRTGSVSRLSNFILWNLAYTELYFTPVLFPDFDVHEFERAIAFLSQQERRFGLTSDQLKDLSK